MRKVDIIATGYTWSCLDCETDNIEIEITEKVTCICCGAEFETSLSENVFGD